MQRRLLVTGGALMAVHPAWAHHGWSSFDQSRPIWLEGRALSVSWRNPHAELTLELAPDLRVPADLAGRALPPQSVPVDGPALLKSASLPTRRDRRWQVELAPLSRMTAWQVAEIKPGDPIGVLGFTFTAEKGEPIVRAEFLWAGGKVAGLRSSPA